MVKFGKTDPIIFICHLENSIKFLQLPMYTFTHNFIMSYCLNRKKTDLSNYAKNNTVVTQQIS